MSLEIVEDPLTGPEIVRFLEEHLEDMRAITPPESMHALDLDALRKPDIRFWTALDAGKVVGCGALKTLDPTHTELKSMRTRPARKRSGVASDLLTHILAEAARMGFCRISLETGSGDFFLPARNLYAKFGFEHCGPFADYRDDPNSVYMTRVL